MDEERCPALPHSGHGDVTATVSRMQLWLRYRCSRREENASLSLWTSFFFLFFLFSFQNNSSSLSVVAVKTQGRVSNHGNGNVAFVLVVIYFQQESDGRKNREQNRPHVTRMKQYPNFLERELQIFIGSAAQLRYQLSLFVNLFNVI